MKEGKPDGCFCAIVYDTDKRSRTYKWCRVREMGLRAWGLKWCWKQRIQIALHHVPGELLIWRDWIQSDVVSSYSPPASHSESNRTARLLCWRGSSRGQSFVLPPSQSSAHSKPHFPYRLRKRTFHPSSQEIHSENLRQGEPSIKSHVLELSLPLMIIFCVLNVLSLEICTWVHALE
jgi:hypothetical protein